MIRKCLMVFAICSALIAPSVHACAAAAPDAPQPNAAPQYTMPEYNAYQAAASEKDAKQRVKLLDDFVAKFPNSTLLNYVYPAYWEAYGQLHNYPKVIEYSEKYLGLPDKNTNLQGCLSAAFQHSLALEPAYNAKDPSAKDYLAKGRDIAQQGLKFLDQFQKPGNMTDAQFTDQVKKPVTATLESAIGFADLQVKECSGAVDAFKALLGSTATDPVVNYRLALSYMCMNPPQQIDGFWYLARAVDLKIADADKIKDYLRKAMIAYQQPTCDSLIDAQLNELLQLAANSTDRPATYSLPSVTDLQKVASTSTILTVLTDLKGGGDKAKLTWLAICGAEFPEVVGKIIEVTPASDSVDVKMYTGATPEEIQAATTANMDVKVVGQPEASRLQKDDGVRFKGTLSGYDPEPFMLHWDKATVNAEDIPAEKGGGKHTPHKVPAKPGKQ